MYSLVKRILFLLPAETAHHLTLSLLRFALKIPLFSSLFRGHFQVRDQRLIRQVIGLDFKNPVGLAAGFDKNGQYIHEFAAMGFGFIEIGTVTPVGQPGNPKPRLFRLPEDRALINRMGFNNEGAENALKNLRVLPKDVVVGGNIGKNKLTPNEKAHEDYLNCFEVLYPAVDYFVVNVSSPNTPNLRSLQDKEPLKELLVKLQEKNGEKPAKKPILLKIAPDLTDDQLNDIIEIVNEIKLDGLVATNTTISREGLSSNGDQIEKIGAGGLSGAPLTKRSTEIIQYLRSHNHDIPIIAVGGIMSAQDALEKLKAGANLVQLYSGLVYRGPALIKEINQAILLEA